MNNDKLAEYIIDRILKGDVFFLGDEDISNCKNDKVILNLKELVLRLC